MSKGLPNLSFFFSVSATCLGEDSKKFESTLSSDTVFTDHKKECSCPKKCINKFTMDMILFERKEYLYLTMEDRRRWLLQKFHQSQCQGKFTYVCLNSGIRVCLKALRIICRLSKNTIGKYRSQVKSQDSIQINRLRRETVRSTECIAWLEKYASMYGDRLPHKKEILLPYKTVRKQVYDSYQTEISHPVSLPTFYRLWNQHFRMLKVKRVSLFYQMMTSDCDTQELSQIYR